MPRARTQDNVLLSIAAQVSSREEAAAIQGVRAQLQRYDRMPPGQRRGVVEDLLRVLAEGKHAQPR